MLKRVQHDISTHFVESSKGRTTDFGSVYSGSNPGSTTLALASKNFKQFGISDPAKVNRPYLRKPTPEDERHPDWESLYNPNG